MQRKPPTHGQIVEANLDLLVTLPNLQPFDPEDPWDCVDVQRTCWACGTWSGRSDRSGRANKSPKMTRSHVVARSRGGSDAPSNFFLLCDVCHAEQPDGMPRESQVEWLRRREDWLTSYSKLIAELLSRVQASVPDASPEDFREWQVQRHEEVTAMAPIAYRNAAGFRNGRAQYEWMLKSDFRTWMAARSTLRARSDNRRRTDLKLI